MREGTRAARAYMAEVKEREERGQGMKSFGCAKSRRVSAVDDTMEQVCPAVFEKLAARAYAAATRKVKKGWDKFDWDLSPYMVNGRVSAPKTIAEAKLRVDWPRWKDAIEVEFGSIDDMEVLIHSVTRKVAREQYKCDHEPILLKSLLDVKHDSGGNIEKYKCRRYIAAHPHAIGPGVPGVTETWAPAPNTAATRIMHAFALIKGMKVRCWDICVAFLHSVLDDDKLVLLRYEPEYRVGEGEEERLCIARRGLYGLPQAPNLWYKTLTTWMFTALNQNGWSCRRSSLDPCMFVLRGPHTIESAGSKVQGKTEGALPAQSGSASATNGVYSSEIESAGSKVAASSSKRPACADLDMGPWDERTVYLIVHVDDCDTTGMCQRNLDELRDMAHGEVWCQGCVKQ
jgi:hypothetical protein